jgi:hypothetical protein
MARKTGEIGTVSQATMRTGDLIESFMAELDRLWPEKAQELREDTELVPMWAYMRTPEYTDGIGDGWLQDAPAQVADLAVMFLNEDLFDLLNECAPPRAYFGPHPGDGCDYGFWYACEDCEYRSWNLSEEDDTEDCPYCEGRCDTCPHADD